MCVYIHNCSDLQENKHQLANSNTLSLQFDNHISLFEWPTKYVAIVSQYA